MPFFKNTREVLGLTVNGLQVQVAHMRREGEHIVLLDLERATLINRLNEEPEAPKTLDAEDFLNLEPVPEIDAPVLDMQLEGDPETNLEIFHRLLSKFPVRQCTLAVSLLETCVFYTEMPHPEGLKGKKLKRHLMAQGQKDRAFSEPLPPDEQHAFFETGAGNLLSIIHEDPLEILSILDTLKPFIGGMPIELIDSIEMTLMNLVHALYPTLSGVVAIVYVGEDFSRVIFTKDGRYLALSQPIHEGFRSPKILHTLCRRMFYEQDVSHLPKIDRIVLTGECRARKTRTAFSRVFSGVQVDYLALPDTALAKCDKKDAALVSNFAVPIALAWETLATEESRIYPANFLPKARRRQQNPFEIAWHGLALLSMLLASILLIGVRVQHQHHTVNTLQLSISLLQDQIRAGKADASIVEDLKARVLDYDRNFALIDSLSAKKRFWSAMLKETATTVGATGHLWLRNFSTTGGGLNIERALQTPDGQLPEQIAISGVASRLERISKFAEQLGNGNIHSTVHADIRGKTVYEFDLNLPVQHSE